MYLLQLMPPPLSLGRCKTAPGGKVRDGKECKVEWLAVLRYSLPPSGIFTSFKSRYLRLTHILFHCVSLSPPLSDCVQNAYISI